MDYFTLPAKDYTKDRNFNIRKHYIDIAANYLHKTKGIDKVDAEKFLRWGIDNGHIPYHDPLMTVFRKDENRDRYEDRVRLSDFLNEVVSRKLILAPTLTCYLPQSQLYSELGGFTHFKYKLRKKTKKEGQIAESEGKLFLAKTKNEMQNTEKTLINSISGTFTIPTTSICNRSGHSTLTSTCRTATAFANTNTERLLAGHRYFEDGEAVIKDIMTILSNVEYERFEKVINKYNFHLITAEELLESLKYSYHTYWRSEYWDEKIYDLCKKLTPLERTIYLYIGDFYHLKKYNEDWVRSFMTKIFGYTEATPLSYEESKYEISKCDEYYSMFVAGVLADTIGSKGIDHRDHEKEPYYGTIGASAKYMREAFDEYGDYFEVFWRHHLQPSNSASFPHAIRRNVLGGDTDSVLMHALNWVIWYSGTHVVDSETKKVSQLMIFLLCMVIKHSLATASGTMGVEEEHIFTLQMKNEFFFNSFSPSNRTKHYINHKGGCEGINYIIPKLEVKGVALKNSKANPTVMERFEDLINEVLSTISSGGKVSINELYDRIGSIEAEIFHSVMRGDVDYLPSTMIKTKEVYKIPMSSDYSSYVLWEEVFADKYGKSPEPPYVGVSVSMNLKNKTALDSWLSSLEDKVIAEKFRGYMQRYDRKGIARIILPHDIVAQTGIPDEIKPIINVRKIIYRSTEPFYIHLEQLGIYLINRHLTKMVLDERLYFIEEKERRWFDGSAYAEIEEIRRKASKFGEQYSDWDKEVSDTIEDELSYYEDDIDVDNDFEEDE